MKKNKGKSLKAKLAAVLSLVPLAGAARSQTFAMDEVTDPVSQSNSLEDNRMFDKPGSDTGDKVNQNVFGDEDNSDAATNIDENEKLDVQVNESLADSPAELLKTAQAEDLYISNWVESVNQVFSKANGIVENRKSELDNVRRAMNDPNNTNLGTNPAVINLRSSLDKCYAVFDDISERIDKISFSLYSGDKLNGKDIINEVNTLEEKLNSESQTADSISNRWKTLNTLLQNAAKKEAVRNDLAKLNDLNAIKTQMEKILLDCKTLPNDLKQLDPTLTGDIEMQLDNIESNVKSIGNKIMKPDRMTADAIHSFAKQMRGYFDEFNSIKSNLNILLVNANKVTNEKILDKELGRVEGVEKAVAAKLNVVLEKREMTDKQYNNLTRIKAEINSMFDKAHQEIDGILKDLSDKGLGNEECKQEDRVKWNNMVNTVIKRINDRIIAWDHNMNQVRKDDLLRRTWDPVEGPKLLLDKMKSKTKVIIEDKNMNIKAKTLQIAKSMNAVQPGTGTAMIPLIRSFLDPNRTMNVTDEFGNIVSDRLAPYSFQLTGTGGTGKTSGAELLAEAFGADKVIVRANDLKDQNAFNLKKNELITAMGAGSKKPVLVIFDEVDTGTCVVTDSSGNRLTRPSRDYQYELGQPDAAHTTNNVDLNGTHPTRNNRLEDVPLQNRPTIDVNGNIVRPGTWKFKYKEGPSQGEVKTLEKGKNMLGTPQLSSHLQRDERGFVNFSEFIHILDQGPNGKVLGIVSTSNYRLDQMPGEVARRIAPTGNEVYVSKPTAKNMSDIVKVRFPALSFSDGYEKKEGAELLGAQAAKYSWTAPKLITNLNQVVNAIRDYTDTECAIPCKSFCKFIAGTYSFDQVVNEARAIKQEIELSRRNADVQKQLNDAVADVGAVTDDLTEQERRDLEENHEIDQEMEALLNGFES